MRAVAFHSALLAVALGAAYVTWTRGSDAPAAPGSVALWEGEEEQVSAIRYETPQRRVALERRSDEVGSYLWATVEPLAGATPLPGTTGPTQFLVGETGVELARAFAAPRALRDLGEVDAEREREYGLVEGTTRLETDLAGETRALVVGGPVFGTGDRYVRDPESGRVYVLPGTHFPYLDSPETLTERRLHAFAPDEVATVVLRASGAERTMRRESASSGVASWAPADAPDRPDQTFATFMERVQQLWADQYAPDVDRGALGELARLDYMDARGEPLGYLVLLRSEAEPAAYYLATEYSRVPVRAFAGAAEALARDVEQLFGGPARSAGAAIDPARHALTASPRLPSS